MTGVGLAPCAGHKSPPCCPVVPGPIRRPGRSCHHRHWGAAAIHIAGITHFRATAHIINSLGRVNSLTRSTTIATSTLGLRCLTAGPARTRPQVRGKFIFAGEERLILRGVTYGTFRPDAHGDEFPGAEIVERDFAMMRAHGINAVRTYTPPPRRLLDAAQRHGLRVMAGLPVERSAAFRDYRECRHTIERMVRDSVRAGSGHPALLCYALGNEIPAPLIRWHGRARFERFLERLYRAAKDEDPQALVTYANYPSTE